MHMPTDEPHADGHFGWRQAGMILLAVVLRGAMFAGVRAVSNAVVGVLPTRTPSPPPTHWECAVDPETRDVGECWRYP
jgi:hypothetical protein